MGRKRPTRLSKVGMPPGTLIHVGKKRTGSPFFRTISYGPESLEEKGSSSEVVFSAPPPPGKVVWMNLDGLHETEILSRMGKAYGIHALVLEDILNTSQRPKMEEVGEFIFFVFKMIDIDPVSAELKVEQVSFLLGKGLLLTFQEKPGDVFDPVRERLRKGSLKIRGTGADYLAYALLDVVVDKYFIVIEHLEERIESLEDRLAIKAETADLREVHRIRRQVSELRQSVWPLREALSRFRGLDTDHLSEGTRIYISDLYDHLIQVLDILENCREGSLGLVDLYLSVASNRMNEVMKLLTIIATLFIPLTFLAGIYGMNFDYMPELHWKWSYPLLWGIMIFLLGGMVSWFRRKKWL